MCYNGEESWGSALKRVATGAHLPTPSRDLSEKREQMCLVNEYFFVKFTLVRSYVRWSPI